jgi:hypothetical protein
MRAVERAQNLRPSSRDAKPVNIADSFRSSLGPDRAAERIANAHASRQSHLRPPGISTHIVGPLQARVAAFIVSQAIDHVSEHTIMTRGVCLQSSVFSSQSFVNCVN